MADLAKLGFEVDTKGLKSGEKALDSFAKTGQKVEGQTEKTSKKVNDNFGKMGRGAGQAGIQFQQFIGQVQGGQSVMLALSQQSADLGFVLGAPLLGAVTGITASLIGMAFAFGKTNVEMVESKDIISELVKGYGDLSDKQRIITENLLTNEIVRQTKALDELRHETLAVGVGFDGLLSSEESIRKEKDSFTASIIKQELALVKLNQQLKTITDANFEFNEVNEESIVKVGELITSLVHAANNYGKNSREISIYKAELLGANEAQIAAINLVNDRIDLLKQEQLAQAESNKAVAAFESMILALEMQRQQLVLTSDQFEVYQAKMRAIASGATPEMIDAIEDIVKVNQKLKKELGLDKESKSFDKLTKDVENFGGTWSKTGSVIVDAFGDMSDGLNDYMDRVKDLDRLQLRINEERKKEGADIVELNKLQQQVNENMVSAELSGIKSVSSATGSLFDEKTAASKAFAALNKIITVAEIAQSFQKMAAKTTETAVVETNNGIQQTSNALTAITAAFSAPFPVGFVAGAAMIGIMAALLGGSLGGGGSSFDPTESRQESQGTGTVFGSDEKSQSILESQERFEDIQIDQLAELRGIKNSLNAVADGISLVVRDLIVAGVGEFGGGLDSSQFTDSQGGNIVGDLTKAITGDFLLSDSIVNDLFGSTKKKVIDSGISFVAQSLAEIMEGGIVQANQFFDIEKKTKKLFGLSKSSSTFTEFQDLDADFNESIGSIFRNIGDVVVDSAKLLGFETVTILESVFTETIDQSFIKDFGTDIASIFVETFKTTELGLEDALSRFQVDIGKISLEGLTGEEIEAELQAVFSQQADLITEFLVPSIAEYQKVGEGLFDTLTRVTQEQVIFNDSIEIMGISLSELSNIIQIDVAQAVIDLTGGIENFAELSASFAENFLSDAEQFAILEGSISDVFDSLGLSMIDSKEEFKALIEGVDLTTVAGQELFAALLAISPAFSDFIDGLEDMDEAIRDTAIDAFSMLEKAIQLDKDRAQASLDIAREAHDAELSRIDELRSALESEQQVRLDNLSSAEDALNASFSAEIDMIQEKASAEIAAIQEASNARISSLNEEKAAISAIATSLRSFVGTIDSALGLGGTDLVAALTSARSGDLSKAQQLDINSLLNLDPGQFSSAEELAVQTAINQNRLNEIGGIAEDQLSEAEKTIAAIDRQIESTKSSAKSQIAAIQESADMEAEALQKQLNELLGIDDSILSLDDAINQFKEAQAALDELNYEQELAKLDMLVKSADDVFSLHEQGYADEIERLDGILEANEALLNAALGIDTSILSVAEAVAALNESILALAQINEGGSGDSIPDAPITPPSSGDLSSTEAEKDQAARSIKDANDENMKIQKEILKNSITSANALQQFKLNGMDTRSIT